MTKKFLYLFFLTLSFTAFSKEVSVSAYIDTATILIGDQVNLTLEVIKPKGLQIEMPLLKDSIIKNVEIVEEMPLTTQISGQNEILTKKYIITSFDSSLYYIPPFIIKYKSDGSEMTEQSNSLALKVFSMPTDPHKPTTLIDIKPVKETPFNLAELLYYAKKLWMFVLGGILILGLIIIGSFYYYNKRNKLIYSKPKPKEPAHLIALRELNNLKQMDLVSRGLIKEYHSQISEILRRYIENRYGIMAMEEVTPEILRTIKKYEILNTTQFETLKEIFEITDLVKFAKYLPDLYTNEKILKHSFEIVEATKIVKVENSETDDSSK